METPGINVSVYRYDIAAWLLLTVCTDNAGRSNLHGRPHAITIMDTTHSVIEGLRFVQSQMWTMTVARSEKVLLQDIYVNNTSSTGAKRHLNTDGCDTLYADDLSFLRWTVDNGDDGK